MAATRPGQQQAWRSGTTRTRPVAPARTRAAGPATPGGVVRSCDPKTCTWATSSGPDGRAATSGAIGGAFGFAALFIELPISTTIMMRAVADVARSEGFDLGDFSTKQACIEVFAMGGTSQADDATETGYYMTRSFTTQAMQQLSKELAGIAAKQGSKAISSLSPGQAGKWLAILIDKVATRFGFTISSKFAAQAVPVMGAFTGATINALFTHFYQDMARGHFIVKRLEEKYGFEPIKDAYMAIKAAPRVN